MPQVKFAKYTTVLAKRVGHGLREFQQSLCDIKEIEDSGGEEGRRGGDTKIPRVLLQFPVMGSAVDLQTIITGLLPRWRMLPPSD